MKIEKIIAITIAAVIILCCFTGTVSARYASGGVENTGIYDGETVFIGEQNLDFSEFSDENYIVDYLEYTGRDRSYHINLDENQCGSIPPDAAEGTYRAYNKTAEGRIGNTVCKVSKLNLGKLSVFPVGSQTSLIETDPSEISKGTGVIFYIDGEYTFLENELKGNWNKLEFRNDKYATITSIKNLEGNEQSLIGIEKPTDKNNRNYAFRFAEQKDFANQPGVISVIARFTVKINNLEREVTYQFNTIDSSFDLKETTISPGNTGASELTSVPFEKVTVSLTNTDENTPYFINGGDGITIIDNHTITAVPGWSGKILLPIKVPDLSKSGDYPITATYMGQTKTSFVRVPSVPAMRLFFEPAPIDAVEGFFATGDGIELKGIVSGASDSVPVYLFIIGPGLPENGAKLEKELSGEVIDGVNESFSETVYSPIFNEWKYIWRTGGFEPGTYTIYASLEPYGYKAVSDPSSPAYKKAVSHDYVISDQSITLKSIDETNGYFTQGDPLIYNFSARGSPGTNGGLRGTVRWYIIGQNFRYADIAENFELVKPDDYGKIAPPGNGEIKYDRSFTQNLDVGTYMLIVQHPGPNMIFDAEPETDVGKFTLITTSGGITSNIGDLQAKNAAYALTELISNPKSDDLYVITEMIMETPSIKINKLENICVGDEIRISGTTNYRFDNEFSVKINKVNFDSPESNIAMLISTERTVPISQTPYSKYMERTFTSGLIDTSTWFPGTYEAKITNIDTGFEQTMTFDVKSQKTESDDNTGTAYIDPSLTTYQTPAPTLPPTATPLPTSTKSSGFVFALPALFAAFAYMLRRR